MAKDIRFGFTVAPVDKEGTPDAALYEEVLADCAHGLGLGYESAWFLEHHFTDYFPTPSPMLFMAHVAARLPALGLGTAVLVTPWYHPIRFAEEVAMLSVLARSELHLGLGRGTAKLEYDAWGIDMEEARERFKESLDILRLAHAGAPFRYEGKHFRMGRTVPTRPAPNRERIRLYGAIGSPQSASMMAEYDLPPLVVANFPMHILAKVIEEWDRATRAKGRPTDVTKPIMIQAWLADTDEEAVALVKRWAPPFFQLQARHYEADKDYYKDIKGYEQFSRFFGNLKKMSDPEQMGPWIDLQIVGSPRAARKRVEDYVAIGFNKFVIQVATVGIPRNVRHAMLTRFAREVAPDFSSAFAKSRAAE